MTTPIERLRTEHRHCSCWGENCAVKRHPNEDWDSHCEQCSVTWPCDTIAALEALEAENVRLRAVVDEVKEWHEQECNCLCDCGECNKPSEPCPLGAAIAALAGDKEATS